MKDLSRKFLLAAIVLLCLTPASFAAKPNRDRCQDGRRNCRPVPEGGAAAIYLLGAGLTCLGAMLVRSRAGNPSHS